MSYKIKTTIAKSGPGAVIIEPAWNSSTEAPTQLLWDTSSETPIPAREYDFDTMTDDDEAAIKTAYAHEFGDFKRTEAYMDPDPPTNVVDELVMFPEVKKFYPLRKYFGMLHCSDLLFLDEQSFSSMAEPIDKILMLVFVHHYLVDQLTLLRARVGL